MASRYAVFLLLLAGLSPPVARAGHSSSYSQHGTSSPPEFGGGKTFRFPDGLDITLVSYKPVAGLTDHPGGQPLRPHPGYRFVTTTWLVRNPTRHAVTIGTWVAKSRGMVSRGFVTGNTGQPGIVPGGGVHHYYWLFEVALTGRVALVYGGFRDEWLPRR